MPPGRVGNDGMKGLGFGSGGVGGREMKECERGGGEACLVKEEDGCIDPDVDLFYIDVKLQHVLGHVQREFEDGVSVENFGAKFGDYGSFLPTYKRSPSILSQLRSPPKDTSHTVVKSPNGLSCKGASNNVSIQNNAPTAKNCPVLIKDLDLEGSARKDASTTVSTTRNPVEDNDLINKGTKGSIRNSLKVRIKVGPNNISDQNNSAIYSGLGLELSPSSSSEDSPEGIEGIFEDGVTNVSQQAILQMMTDFPIAEDCFLSPLQENLLSLANEGEDINGNHRGDLLGKSISEVISISGQLNSPLRSSQDSKDIALKILHENTQIGGFKSELNNDKVFEKKVDVETVEGQDLTFQTSSIPLLLDSRTAESKILVRKVVSKTQEDSAIGTKKTFDEQTESRRILPNDNNIQRLGNRNSFDSERSMEGGGVAGLKERAFSCKVQPSPRVNLTRGEPSKKNMICGNTDLSCLLKERMDKPENDMEFDGPKVYEDHIIGTKLDDAKKADELSEVKRKLKVNASNATSLTDLPKKTTVSLCFLPGKDEKKLHSKEGVEIKSKQLKSMKESLHEDLKHSQREVAWEGKDEVVLGKMQPLIAKNRINDINIVKKKSRVRSVDKKSAFSSSNEAPIQTCTDAAVAAVPIVIKDNWACCDRCEKWRLLPSGTNPDDLPNKWTCSMQVWLPVGMNHCLISEDETTKFMNPQCHESLLESNAIPDHSAPSASSASLHVNQASCQMGSINDTNCNYIRRLSDASMETQNVHLKAKRKSLQCSSNGVGTRQSKDSKLIGKGLINSDISGPKKTIHPDGFHLLNKDSKISSDLTPKVMPYLANSSSAVDLTWKQMGELGDKFLSNSVRELKGSCSSLNGTMKAHVGVHAGRKFKQAGLIDSELSDNSLIPVKKRKAREWHEIQNNQTAMRSRHLGEKGVMLGEDSRSVKKKENKFNTSNSATEAYSTSKITSASGKSHDKTKRTCRTGKLFIDDKVDNQVAAVHASAEGNSVGKTYANNLGASAIERSNRCFSGEVNGKMSQGSRKKESSCFIQGTSVGRSPGCKSMVLSPLDGVCGDPIKASSILDCGKAESEAVGINVVNSVPSFFDHHGTYDTDPLNPFKNLGKFNEAAGNADDIASRHCEDGTVISESEEELHSLRNGMQGTPNQCLDLMSSTKAKGFEVCPTGETVNGLLELDKLEKASDGKNVARNGNFRREKAEEPSDQPPMRKCVASNAALVAMKEAKELKHAADRMKNLGQELEGIALYFQATLKFLQAAFLSEPSSNADIKYNELNELLKTYTQTAGLCEFCAREYEKKKDMAFAALAYKCMEVAYFKVAFFKCYVVSKDYHELQATVQTFLQDGSPSSSASDLDNLNQPGALEKVTYSKVASSLQNTGIRGVVSRATFSRWLDWTNVSIFAFEASRKSQNALSAASAALEHSGCGSIASVEDALNFNFHNIEELVRRIRAAMESFNH
ncbi:uncharacterized protein LOC110037325 isoform X2 [Phalaenopsis equestris]|uniref:uncharacterized protein LOC110037325 isoform X2 n=1 Tax=Phalaenopsis equestris TaxID=78828 RepID=UPI0009E32085|nr:uncharacterized protein LOC110037325 isoform X2 [Phalaenopsis equestris]